MEQELNIIYYSAAEDFRSKQYPDPKYCIRFYYLNKERIKIKKKKKKVLTLHYQLNT